MSDEIHGVAAAREIELPFDGECKITLTPKESRRFWAKVHESTVGKKCWIWTGAYLNAGYGVFALRKKGAMKVHRLSYLMHVGPIPRGMIVCHSCDEKHCLNPAHLWVGTHQQNTDDCVAKNLHAYGEKNVKAALTEAQVIEIRGAWAKRPMDKKSRGFRAQIKKKLSIKYQVTPEALGYLLRGETWPHVGGPIEPSREKRRRTRKSAPTN